MSNTFFFLHSNFGNIKNKHEYRINVLNKHFKRLLLLNTRRHTLTIKRFSKSDVIFAHAWTDRVATVLMMMAVVHKETFLHIIKALEVPFMLVVSRGGRGRSNTRAS